MISTIYIYTYRDITIFSLALHPLLRREQQRPKVLGTRLHSRSWLNLSSSLLCSRQKCFFWKSYPWYSARLILQWTSSLDLKVHCCLGRPIRLLPISTGSALSGWYVTCLNGSLFGDRRMCPASLIRCSSKISVNGLIVPSPCGYAMPDALW
jgi:hypothetical protein